jgi:hypothetical protein
MLAPEPQDDQCKQGILPAPAPSVVRIKMRNAAVEYQCAGAAMSWVAIIPSISSRGEIAIRAEIVPSYWRFRSSASEFFVQSVGTTCPTIRLFQVSRRHSGRVVILRPGSGSCRGRIRPAANRISGQSRNRVTNTSGVFLLSESILSCGVRASSRRSIPGSLGFSLGDRSRLSPSRWPTRWRGSPGHCWRRVGTYRTPQLVAV